MILHPGLNLTLRPMKYPQLYERYVAAIKNNWTVEEVDFSQDITDLRTRLTPAERHMIQRLVAFFATGDSIVSNNLALNFYTHLNAPEARLYLSRQLFEEALHVQFYLTLLDTYITDPEERNAAFRAVETIPSIQKKAEFSTKWMDTIRDLPALHRPADRRRFLLNLIAYAACIEGLFFFAAFAYVYFLRSKGLLPGLSTGTNWVFRDESAHIEFALETIDIIRSEEPGLFDAELEGQIAQMVREAVECETAFARDVLGDGVPGMSLKDMRQYLEHVADLRVARLGLKPLFGSKNPFAFLQLQDLRELTHFFERRVSAYQVGVTGKVKLDGQF
jgi:ribonucleoside-diphosphate reductase beta chain